ncbi:MAG: hypothetical protein Q8P79_01775 [Nanoarchaeota archaeon]|nr:hypothetical protein [Nanoarchaeota archaeon]
MNKKIILPIISSLATFFSGASLLINFYLAIAFFILGIFSVYHQAKNTIEIIARPEGFPPPNSNSVPKGSLFVSYKK